MQKLDHALNKRVGGGNIYILLKGGNPPIEESEMFVQKEGESGYSSKIDKSIGLREKKT